ncbi:hypothetical protein FHR33_000612 [Nonomuraea dietziae]|uniref:Uncharacterized protein n=1 Tax=Nonomuraea dietziae TaxID=65515 RepID=A0A7W5UUA7_9ACTN|nr:hypothetical protein [Nonomuraea dietziae]
MTIFSERVEALQAAAQDGDAEATREYGRLLSLLPGAAMAEDEPLWAGEPWLRAAVATRPDDTLARPASEPGAEWRPGELGRTGPLTGVRSVGQKYRPQGTWPQSWLQQSSTV